VWFQQSHVCVRADLERSRSVHRTGLRLFSGPPPAPSPPGAPQGPRTQSYQLKGFGFDDLGGVNKKIYISQYLTGNFIRASVDASWTATQTCGRRRRGVGMKAEGRRGRSPGTQRGALPSLPGGKPLPWQRTGARRMPRVQGGGWRGERAREDTCGGKWHRRMSEETTPGQVNNKEAGARASPLNTEPVKHPLRPPSKQWTSAYYSCCQTIVLKETVPADPDNYHFLFFFFSSKQLRHIISWQLKFKWAQSLVAARPVLELQLRAGTLIPPSSLEGMRWGGGRFHSQEATWTQDLIKLFTLADFPSQATSSLSVQIREANWINQKKRLNLSHEWCSMISLR